MIDPHVGQAPYTLLLPQRGADLVVGTSRERGQRAIDLRHHRGIPVGPSGMSSTRHHGAVNGSGVVRSPHPQRSTRRPQATRLAAPPTPPERPPALRASPTGGGGAAGACEIRTCAATVGPAHGRIRSERGSPRTTGPLGWSTDWPASPTRGDSGGPPPGPSLGAPWSVTWDARELAHALAPRVPPR
jgi:hypothetical protein